MPKPGKLQFPAEYQKVKMANLVERAVEYKMIYYYNWDLIAVVNRKRSKFYKVQPLDINLTRHWVSDWNRRSAMKWACAKSKLGKVA